jgi:arylsulfatase A-like enzyme
VQAFVSGLVALTATLYYHPGAKHAYISYIPGLIGRIWYPAGPYQEIEWSRQELPRNESSMSAQPNIIIILADDLGYNDLFGGAGAATPHIDKLRQSGVWFDQAYAGHATCSPARASLLTGRYPSRFGYEFTAVPWQFSWVISRPKEGAARQPIFNYHLLPTMPPSREMNVPLNETMIPKVLQDAGYTTAYLGKWHLGSRPEYVPWDRGFDETLGFLGAASMYGDVNDPDIINAYLGDPLDDFLFNNLRDIVRHNGSANYFTPKEYMTDYLAIQAAECIKTKMTIPDDASRMVPPLFMYVAFNAPHTPLQAKRDDYDSPELSHIADPKERVYAAMIKALDRGVGTIMTAIEATGQGDNTLVIFTSDNGGASYVGLKDMNKPFRWWKATFFEGGFRVPMFMSWPARIKPTSIYSRPVSHVDIFATCAAAGLGRDGLAELAKDKVYDGVDLLPFLNLLVVPPNECTDAHETCASSRTSSNDPHQSLFWRTGSYMAMRAGYWKIQVSEIPDRVWITDFSTDPHEHNNLVWGMTWTMLNTSVSNEITVSLCADSLERVAARGRPSPDAEQWSRIILEAACALGAHLLQVNSEQVEPLWPALSVTPVPVDYAAYAVMSEKEEYVYWAN